MEKVTDPPLPQIIDPASKQLFSRKKIRNIPHLFYAALQGQPTMRAYPRNGITLSLRTFSD